MAFPDHRATRPNRKPFVVAVPVLVAILLVGGIVAVELYGGNDAAPAGQSANGAVAATGSLRIANASVTQGSTVTFDYSTSAAMVNVLNWVGVYSNPGNGPVAQTYAGLSTVWDRAGALSGTVTLSTASLTPGTYIAYYLYADGYKWLAQPVTFTVT